VEIRLEESMKGKVEEKESLEQVTRRFPELDEPARRRAALRMAAGEKAQAAFAQESVILQMVRAYNP
jgi:ABC-type branched-subunit amino acid transport system ATPase component